MTAPLTPIPGLRRTVLYETAVAIYQRHRQSELGVCGACGQPAPCPARHHAALVISSTGTDPEPLEERSSPTYSGWQVGGRGRPLDESALMYERDSD
ncbi:hypothetical protein EFE23_26680 [Micromonospora solifontis]|uniref:Uncharacterized protein n=1 Tax=Micromonospora solifontis TaxID=2487138 RepID=A0ABX9WAU1_9ACTN|nr:hypothetical protein EFE23_26680 [Micromonospora solifontis]